MSGVNTFACMSSASQLAAPLYHTTVPHHCTSPRRRRRRCNGAQWMSRTSANLRLNAVQNYEASDLTDSSHLPKEGAENARKICHFLVPSPPHTLFSLSLFLVFWLSSVFRISLSGHYYNFSCLDFCIEKHSNQHTHIRGGESRLSDLLERVERGWIGVERGFEGEKELHRWAHTTHRVILSNIQMTTSHSLRFRFRIRFGNRNQSLGWLTSNMP